MTRLDFLHEPAILFNLRRRFFRSLPYTYTGEIVIAVNPYRWVAPPLSPILFGVCYVRLLGGERGVGMGEGLMKTFTSNILALLGCGILRPFWAPELFSDGGTKAAYILQIVWKFMGLSIRAPWFVFLFSNPRSRVAFIDGNHRRLIALEKHHPYRLFCVFRTLSR